MEMIPVTMTITDLNYGDDPCDHDHQVGQSSIIAETAGNDPKGGVGKHAAGTNLYRFNYSISISKTVPLSVNLNASQTGPVSTISNVIQTVPLSINLNASASSLSLNITVF